MKIKTVSEMTGLSDRTIRYYIEERLISPAYTENYLGRKSFVFSDKDIQTLNSISVLRQYDFTIDEIRRIAQDSKSSSAVIFDVRKRTAENASANEVKQQAISKLYTTMTYTLEQLADELSNPSVALPAHHESTKQITQVSPFTVLKTFLVFSIVLIPILLTIFVITLRLIEYHYPVFEPLAIGMTIVFLLPSLSILFFRGIKWKWKRWLLLLCILSLFSAPFASSLIITGSETNETWAYRRFDADCTANKDSFLQALFPIIEGVADTHYYYRYNGYSHDIYAEWSLDKEAFDSEVARIEKLYHDYSSHLNPKAYTYDVVQKGNYTCLFIYRGAPPFTAISENYWWHTYYIFAYDTTNKIVRYISCYDSESIIAEPYYLTLNW